LWRGPALAEFASESFAIPEISRLEELRLTALEERIDADLKLGRHGELVAELRGLVAEHPLRERLCGQLMLALYRSGVQAEASDVFLRARTRLVDERGMEPGPALQRLFQDILGQASHLEWQNRSPTRHNLPQPLTRFIGRGADLAELIDRLRNVRLLTLTGPGGIGKTRLAIELAAQTLDLFPDGTWLIDLSPIADAELVPQAVAAELKVPEQPGRRLAETLAGHLRERRGLLVLDSCERVLEASADFTLEVLTNCPDMKVLATSRERLGVVGEQVWPVSPLTVPDTSTTVAEMPQFEALQLFIDRAALVQPHFALDESNASAVVQICRRLDGIPLAVELAAARADSLAPAEIAARLDDRFRLLEGHERGRPPRHQTLQAALEWSHQLLDRQQRVLFRQLSSFAGSFDEDAIRSISSHDREQPDPGIVVAQLVEKSLILIEDSSDRRRYRMLETVRQFARDRLLATGQAPVLGSMHARHFSNVVTTHAAKLRSTGARDMPPSSIETSTISGPPSNGPAGTTVRCLS
jgi:predicted ATPase